jgi:hypothetical protein
MRSAFNSTHSYVTNEDTIKECLSSVKRALGIAQLDETKEKIL